MLKEYIVLTMREIIGCCSRLGLMFKMRIPVLCLQGDLAIVSYGNLTCVE
jgi:hypothetical protein